MEAYGVNPTGIWQTPSNRKGRKLGRRFALALMIMAAMGVMAFFAVSWNRVGELSRSLAGGKGVQYTMRQIMEPAADTSVHEVAEARTSSRSLRVKEDMPYALPGAGAEDEEDTGGAARTVSFAKSSEGRQIPNGKVELLDWFTKGRKAFPRGKQATVIDVETGLSFKVRRFGGEYHADSYPLTKADTAVMKRIYGGKWSWDRRAIWVVVGKHTIAASMNGMPHMVDANLKDGFDGHFCIHFYKSMVHRTGNECPVHQTMVKKAFIAGQPKDRVVRR